MSHSVQSGGLFPLSIDVDQDAKHGEIYTRGWVVDFMLDLIDYRPDRDLAQLRLVEPACGSGAFLAPIARRISESCRKHDRPLEDAVDAVRAYDLLVRNAHTARRRVSSVLAEDGWAAQTISDVTAAWIGQGDYLLESGTDMADVVVGNPPYIRLEDLPEQRMRLYRRACPTMTGRADLYVGFFETALRSLRSDGVLAFICADRWMRNQYGRELRRLVGKHFAVDAVVTMHDVDAFFDRVSAYPAITVIRRTKQRSALVVETSRKFDHAGSRELTSWLPGTDGPPTPGSRKTGRGFAAASLPHWFPGDDMWPAGSPARLAMLEQLADRFIPLGDPRSGVRVGIGVATGADRIFLTKDPDLVEPSRLLPLTVVRDTGTGTLSWSGHYLVNPWDDDGNLVDLDLYPRLAAHFRAHADALSARHVGRRQPARWYRTIDKVDAALTRRPKLLFPDMKLTSQPVLDPGGYYPHHNLYFVTSDEWDLRALGGLLLSKVAGAFIDALATKMRGGTLRFQAQYLRRICVPSPWQVADDDRRALADAFDRRDVAAATATAARVYGLDR